MAHAFPRTLSRIACGVAALAMVGCQPKPAEPKAAAAPSAAPPPAQAAAQPQPAKINHQDEAASKAAFLAAYPVFMHPRCLNCHPSGDAPLQGEDSHIHTQNVKRGPYGSGLYGNRCSSCHQAANVPGPGMPPGSPTWQLPPETMKMVFQGRTPAQLAAQLRDPNQNGHKSLEELVKHVTDDRLVLWAWTPGDGRAPPPLPHDEFAKLVQEWVNKGAACPD